MAGTTLCSRFAERPLAEALEDSPVVLIHGPRQCGKATLAQMVCAPDQLAYGGDRLTYGNRSLGQVAPRSRDCSYLSFDDQVVRAGAEADPMGFVADLPERVVLDEVRRVSGLFAALKMEVDRGRAPGRFVLTGSTNVLLVPALSDSLAGRMALVRLHPLAQCELTGPSLPDRPAQSVDRPPGFLGALFRDGLYAVPVRLLWETPKEIA